MTADVPVPTARTVHRSGSAVLPSRATDVACAFRLVAGWVAAPPTVLGGLVVGVLVLAAGGARERERS